MSSRASAPLPQFRQPADEQPSRSASTLPSMEDSPIDNSKLWSAVFKLYDRDNSGFADEGDTVAAMVTMGREREQARKMLARRCEDGRPNLELCQEPGLRRRQLQRESRPHHHGWESKLRQVWLRV